MLSHPSTPNGLVNPVCRGQRADVLFDADIRTAPETRIIDKIVTCLIMALNNPIGHNDPPQRRNHALIAASE